MDKIPKEAIESLKKKLEAEARKADAEARVYTADAEQAEITLRKAKYDEENRLATNERHCVYLFNSVVSEGSINVCIDQLTTWSRTRPKKSITIVFNSPGGAIVAGMALFDFIQEMKRLGHHITTKALGMAASMAGILLQAGDERVMGKEAWVLLHEASFGAVGKIGEVEDTVEWVKKVQRRILNIFAERSTLSKSQIERRWKRKDWWLSSDDCLKLGFVDKVE